MDSNKKKHIQSTSHMTKNHGWEHKNLESNNNSKRNHQSISNHDKGIINTNGSTIRKNNLVVGGYMKDGVLLGSGTCCCCGVRHEFISKTTHGYIYRSSLGVSAVQR